jgi:hypothetical protein
VDEDGGNVSSINNLGDDSLPLASCSPFPHGLLTRVSIERASCLVVGELSSK